MAERHSSEAGEPRKRPKTELKAVVVGDGGCGKTSLLLVHAKGAFPEQYAPSVFEKYTTNVIVGKKEVVLHLYDTAGQEDYDRLRPLSYQSTHVVLICYDVMNPFSFDNVLIKWIQEVNHFCRGIPILLVGCKTDLRKDKEHLRKLRSAQQEPITYKQEKQQETQVAFRKNTFAYNHDLDDLRISIEAKRVPLAISCDEIEGEEASCQIGASMYLECSAKFRENVEPIFREAASIALNAIKKARRQNKSRPCVLL